MGCSRWPCSDFADAHPDTEVIGTDISPIQPQWCPPNLTFEIDDTELDWTFERRTFDFVHARYLLGSIQDWPRLFRQAYDSLRPGGYVESHESEPQFLSDDNTVRPDSAMATWTTLFAEGSSKLGRPFMVISENLQRKAIEEAGFVDIQVTDQKVWRSIIYRATYTQVLIRKVTDTHWRMGPGPEATGDWAICPTCP